MLDSTTHTTPYSTKAMEDIAAARGFVPINAAVEIALAVHPKTIPRMRSVKKA
jgi:hypothetical protein